MRRRLALLAAVVVAVACDPGGHQLWVVNERPEAVIVKVELLAQNLTPLPGEEPRDYMIPARSGDVPTAARGRSRGLGSSFTRLNSVSSSEPRCC